MVPGSLGEMADRVDHHQRALPAGGPVFAPDPAVLEIPMRQFGSEALPDLVLSVSPLALPFGHVVLLQPGSLCHLFPEPAKSRVTSANHELHDALARRCTMTI